MKRKTRSRKNQQIEEDDSDNIDVNRSGLKSNTTSEKHISCNVTNFVSIKDRPIIPKSIFLQILDCSLKNKEEQQNKKQKVSSTKLSSIIEDDIIQYNRRNLQKILNNKSREEENKSSKCYNISYISTKTNPIRYVFNDLEYYRTLFKNSE